MKFLLVLFLIFSFIGISESFAQEFDFEIWPTESVVRYPDFPTIEFTLTPAPSGPFESFYIEKIDELVPEDNILVVFKITTPDGNTDTSIGHFHLDDITQYLTKVSFGTPTAGEYSITGNIFWQTNGELFTFSSDTVTITAKDPVFRGMIDKISVEQKLQGIKLFDWSPDGNQILFRYVVNSGIDEWQEKLATMTLDGNDVIILPITNLTDENQFYDARFSPDGNYIHVYMDDRNLYRFDLNTEEITQLTHQGGIYDFDYYHYNEDEPGNYSITVSVENEDTSENSEDSILLDIGNGEQEDSLLDAHALIYDFESFAFDISPDGKKILFKRTLNSSFPPERILAYVPAQGDIVEIPTSDANCGSTPKWSPNGEMIIYSESSCGRGAPGSTIHLTSIDGKYREILLPYANDNSGNFIVSPDGALMIFGTGDGMEIMTLAKPIPEFETIAMMILIVSIIPIMLVSKIRKLSF